LINIVLGNITLNNLHYHLKLDIHPLQVPMDSLPKEPWNLIPVEFIEPKLINFLKTRGIVINTVSSFYEVYSSYGHQPGPIHTDLHGLGDMTKLIWNWGPHHEMSWYAYKASVSKEANFLENDKAPEHNVRKYTEFELKKLDKIYSVSLGLPSLIQVGIPHQVITFAGVRRSLTMILNDLQGNTIPMDTAKLIFKDNLFY
jgi:hypothetical protein